MAAGTTIKLKGKAGAFTGGQLAAREAGIDTTNSLLQFSADGSANKTVVNTDNTQTLTNKRNQKRVSSTATGATLTPEIDTADIWIRTAQAAALNIANHSTSTPADGEMMEIKIKDNGTARAITYGTNYRDMATTKATTTVISKWLIQLWQWSAADSKWDLLTQIQQP